MNPGDSSPTGAMQEPSVRAQPTGSDERIIKVYERVESLLTLIVALLLIGFVLIALAGVVIDVRGPLIHDHNFTEAALGGIDSIFLAIILLELLHTALSHGPVSQQVQEFLVIGITAAVRHGLEVAAPGHGKSSHAVVIDLAINSAAVLVLVLALWLIRQQLRADQREIRLERTATDRPDVTGQ